MPTDKKGAKDKEKKAVSGNNFDFNPAGQASGNQQQSGITGSRPKSSHGKTKKAPGTPNAGGQIPTVKLIYNYKQIKCMEKSDFFKSRIPSGIAVSIEGDTIELKGKDRQVLKLAKDSVEKCKESLKLASLSIHSIQALILKKSDVINFINECLDIDNMVVTWDVVEVADQARLNVFSFDKKEADEMIKKVMACIVEERVKVQETGLPWFQNLLRKEQSKLTTTKSSAGDIIVYTTIDVREKYFVVNRPSPVNLSSSVGQQHASNYLITGTDPIDPTKQPSTANQQATPRDNKHKHKDSKEMEEKQAHDSKQTKLEYVEALINLSFQQIKYINQFLSEQLLSICKKNVIEYELVDNNIVLQGTSKNVTLVKKEIYTLLDGYPIKSEQVYCGKPFVSDECRQNWKKMEKDKRCVIKAQQCKKPSIESGWVINSEEPKMHIIYLKGPIWLADVDVILCPVTDQLFPVGTTTDSLKEGIDHTSQNKYFTVRDEKPGSKWEVGEVIPVNETGNLGCQCLYLCVQDQIKKGVVNEKAIENLAKRIIGNLQMHGYQSVGLVISYDDVNPALKTFLFSLASHLWKHSAGLKFPILLCCYCDSEEEMESFDKHLRKSVKIQDFLYMAILENLEMKGQKNVDISIMVHEGSILDFDSKVDVIVNSVGTDLNLQNGLVSKMLVDKAGPTIQVECNKQYKDGTDIGQIVATTAGKLKCKRIFHITLYTRWVSTGNLSIEILKNLVTRCLEKAEETGSNSIIFPALGTGTLGYPPCLVAKTMFDAVYEFGKTRNPKHLQKVHFVLFEKEVVQLFRNISEWKKITKKEKTEFHVPLKHVMLVEKDIETRIMISDRDYYSGLHYKELRIVLSEKDDSAWKLEWDLSSGSYATLVRTAQSESQVQHFFQKIICMMEEKRFHVVDICFHNNTLRVPLQKHIDILRNELRAHSDSIEQYNIKLKGKKKLLKVNYIKTVRLFVMSDEYCAFVNDISNSNRKTDGLGLYHISDKCAFPFLIEVMGQKKDAMEVMKTVKHDISSIEATMRLEIKIKQNQLKEAKKKLKKLKDSGPKFSFDEDSCSIVFEGTKSQINKAKKDLENFQELEICLDMNEEDFTALLYITSEDPWRLHLRHSSYSKGKAIFQMESSANLEKLTRCIESELNNIHQLATSEVVPPQKFEDQFSTLQSEVEDVEQGIFCFLSNDKSKIIIKASKYEQAQQAKYMVEVNLGMVQQGGGRRNRKFASPDEIGPGPVASPSSSSEVTIRGGINFKTKEGIVVFVYSTGIGNLKVDTLVNAANRDLMHGGGIAYHISNAAGYILDKECDDYIRAHGPLSVGTCCSTTAGKLPYKTIIHAVGPMWHSYKHDRKQHCLDDLKKTILSALEEAGSQKLKSIAIPSISSGIFGVPKELCAKQYFRAVVEYSRNSATSSVREIHFIDKDRGMCSLIQKTFEKEFGYKGQQM